MFKLEFIAITGIKVAEAWFKNYDEAFEIHEYIYQSMNNTDKPKSKTMLPHQFVDDYRQEFLIDLHEMICIRLIDVKEHVKIKSDFDKLLSDAKSEIGFKT
jgi:hypothetical protein